MSWTKRQFISQAFEEIGLSSFVFDLTPEQLESALRKMDSMVAGWNANGVRISYPLPGSPQYSNIDSESGVPDFANEAIYLGLASRLCASFGKNLSPETKMFADIAYNNMANAIAIPTQERQLPSTTPRGQGTKYWRNNDDPYVRKQEEMLLSGTDGDIEFE